MLHGLSQIKIRRRLNPHAYQNEADDALLKDWAEFNRLLCVLPTGGGKSLVAGEIAAKTVAEEGRRVLFLAHTRKLVRQFRRAFEDDFGIAGTVEMADEKSDDSMLVCSTDKTMAARVKAGKFDKDEFGLIILDEAHRSLSEGFQTVVSHFDRARVLGITATPRRTDQKDLMKFFEKKSVDIPLTRLIKEGFLSPIKIRNVPIKIKVSGASKTGDYTEQEVAHAIEPYLESIADSLKLEGAGRCCLIFLPLIDTSKKFNHILNDIGVRSVHLDGTMSEKEQNDAIRRLELGEIDAICNSMLLTEGVDIRPVNLVMNLRPTRSWTLYTQIVGRGTRIFDPAFHPPEGTRWKKKDNLLLLDPLWQCDQHNLLQRPATLIATTDEEADEVDGMLDDEDGDLMEAVDSARAKREETLRERLKAMENRKAREVDAMELFLNIGRMDLVEYEPISKWELAAITPGQREVLSKWGFDIDTIKGKGHASQIIDAFIQRGQQGYPSVKQAKYARDLGMIDPWNRSKADVSKFIEDSKAGKKPYAKIPS